MKLNFRIEKETKGAVQYKECNSNGSVKAISDGAVIGTLYVRKAALPASGIPPVLSVDLEFPTYIDHE